MMTLQKYHFLHFLLFISQNNIQPNTRSVPNFQKNIISILKITSFFLHYVCIKSNESEAVSTFEGTQRFIRVNVYSCSSSSLLATFSEQNKDFFSKVQFYSRILFLSTQTNAPISNFNLLKQICERITSYTCDFLKSLFW